MSFLHRYIYISCELFLQLLQVNPMESKALFLGVLDKLFYRGITSQPYGIKGVIFRNLVQVDFMERSNLSLVTYKCDEVFGIAGSLWKLN